VLSIGEGGGGRTLNVYLLTLNAYVLIPERSYERERGDSFADCRSEIEQAPLAQAALGNPRGLGRSQLGNPHGLKKLIVQNDARVGEGEFRIHVRFGLVVFDDCNLLGICAGPREANAPLVFDADGMLSGAIALQGLEPVARRETPGAGAVPEFFGLETGKALDRRRNLRRYLYPTNRYYTGSV
jgi:hypothetical protein